MAALTRLDSMPATARASHGASAFRTGVSRSPCRGHRPHEAVVTQPGDQLGCAVDGRIASQGFEPAVDPVIDGPDHHQQARSRRVVEGRWIVGREESPVPDRMRSGGCRPEPADRSQIGSQGTWSLRPRLLTPWPSPPLTPLCPASYGLTDSFGLTGSYGARYFRSHGLDGLVRIAAERRTERFEIAVVAQSGGSGTEVFLFAGLLDG